MFNSPTSIIELQERIDEINKLINETIVSDDPEIFPITDGIIDINKYVDAKYRILWILKEPYDDFDKNGKPFGGGWGIGEAINPKKEIHEFNGGRQTFKPMIYTSWGILNNFCLWDNMKDVEDDPTMIDALKSVAYINIKKIPGHTKSDNGIIEGAYRQHKDILLKQIDYYNPHIVIGGSTLYNFFNDFGFTREEMQTHKSVNYIIKNNKIFIEAYHPAQRTYNTGVSQEQYCDDIITVSSLYNVSQQVIND